MTQIWYGEHAKRLRHRLGEFDLDTMEKSIFAHGRYAAIDFPGIPTATSFHQLEASPIFLTLHDELHRRLISGIYNPSYHAYLYAVNVIKTKTGIARSREIWDAVDMEIGGFTDQQIQEKKMLSQQDIEHHFMLLLQARIFTQKKRIGLFTASPFIDTLWLLLIDMVLNPDLWKKMQIDFGRQEGREIYHLLYQFVVRHADLWQRGTSPAHQVAIVKALWLGMDIPTESQDIQFVVKEKPRYLEVSVDGKALGMTKQEYMMITEAIEQIADPSGEESLVQVITDELPDNPELIENLLANINKLIMLVSYDLEFARKLIKQTSDFNKIMEIFPAHQHHLIQTVLLDSVTYNAIVLTPEQLELLFAKFSEREERIGKMRQHFRIASSMYSMFSPANQDGQDSRNSQITSDAVPIRQNFFPTWQ